MIWKPTNASCEFDEWIWMCQAWVTAAVKPKVEDCAVMDASAGAKLHQILFFPPPPEDPQTEVPSIDNAYLVSI